MPECKKTFKSQGTMMQHKDRFHKIVSALSQSPLANSVRTLFTGESVDDTSQPSTQGGSDGSVNSPKVVTQGVYQCDLCQTECEKKVDLDKHKSEHDKSQDAPINETDNDLNGSKSEESDLLEAVREVDRDTVDSIVNAFVDTAFQQLN